MQTHELIEQQKQKEITIAYLDLIDADEIDMQYAWQDLSWMRTKNGKKAKRIANRKRRKSNCSKCGARFIKFDGQMKFVPFVCGEYTTCEDCRKFKIFILMKNLSRYKELYVRECKRPEEESIKKRIKRHKGNHGRIPLEDKTIMLSNVPLDDFEPIQHHEIKQQLEDWLQKVDTLNGKKLSGKLFADEEKKKASGNGEKLESGIVQITNAITRDVDPDKNEEAYQIARQEMDHSPVTSFEELQKSHKSFMVAYINALGGDIVVDTLTAKRTATSEDVKDWNSWMSRLLVKQKNLTSKTDMEPEPETANETLERLKLVEVEV